MLIAIMALSLLCHIGRPKKTHHFIAIECACMKEIIDGIVNLAYIPDNVIRMFA